MLKHYFKTNSLIHGNINDTHHRHFTLVYLFGNNLTTLDTETARELSINAHTCSFQISPITNCNLAKGTLDQIEAWKMFFSVSVKVAIK